MKLPEPVAWMYVNDDGECEQIEHGNDMPDGYCQFLYTEMQVKAMLAQQVDELRQLQEQNTALDARLASNEAVMRMALEALTSDEHCNCIPTPLTDEAIKALKEQLK